MQIHIVTVYSVILVKGIPRHTKTLAKEALKLVSVHTSPSKKISGTRVLDIH
jgi:hypothetical protein